MGWLSGPADTWSCVPFLGHLSNSAFTTEYSFGVSMKLVSPWSRTQLWHLTWSLKALLMQIRLVACGKELAGCSWWPGQQICFVLWLPLWRAARHHLLQHL